MELSSDSTLPILIARPPARSHGERPFAVAQDKNLSSVTDAGVLQADHPALTPPSQGRKHNRKSSSSFLNTSSDGALIPPLAGWGVLRKGVHSGRENEDDGR